MAKERLQKVLAQAGIASRRAAEALITAGRVKVSGRIVRELGTRADVARERVEVDGRRVMPEAQVYVVLHKPRACMSTLRDPESRATVKELVSGIGRVVPVGRLDYHTSGVLLMTNDGEFAARLSHPRGGVPKVYVAKVHGRVDDDGLEKFRRSIDVDGKSTRAAEVRRLRWEGDKTWLEITLREGKNRQIHRLGEAAGFPVLRLARISYAGVTHEGLRPGQWRFLSRDELAALKKAHGVPLKVRTAAVQQELATRPGAARQTLKSQSSLARKPSTASGPTRRPSAGGGAGRRDSGVREPGGGRPARAFESNRRDAATRDSSGGRVARARGRREAVPTESPAGGRPARGRGRDIGAASAAPRAATARPHRGRKTPR